YAVREPHSQPPGGGSLTARANSQGSGGAGGAAGQLALEGVDLGTGHVELGLELGDPHDRLGGARLGVVAAPLGGVGATRLGAELAGLVGSLALPGRQGLL